MREKGRDAQREYRRKQIQDDNEQSTRRKEKRKYLTRAARERRKPNRGASEKDTYVRQLPRSIGSLAC